MKQKEKVRLRITLEETDNVTVMLLESLRYASVIDMQTAVSDLPVVFDLMPPAVVHMLKLDPKEWAMRNRERMKSFGIMAEVILVQ